MRLAQEQAVHDKAFQACHDFFFFLKVKTTKIHLSGQGGNSSPTLLGLRAN